MSSQWSYRVPLPKEVIESVEIALHQADFPRSLAQEPTKSRISRYWAAFIYDEIWIGLGNKIFRLRKKTGLLLNTFVVPEDFYASFEESCIIPLRPLGPGLLIFGVSGRRRGEEVLLPFVLDFSTLAPSFVILDALEGDCGIDQIDWHLHLTKEISPYQRPMVGEIDVTALRNIYEFVILNLSDLIDARKMTLVCKDPHGATSLAGEFDFATTDNCYTMAVSPRADRTLRKEIALAGDTLSVDFHEKTHVCFHYQAA